MPSGSRSAMTLGANVWSGSITTSTSAGPRAHERRRDAPRPARRGVVTRTAVDAVGVGDRDHVRERQAAAGTLADAAAAEQVVLRLPDRHVAVVVEDEDLDRQLVLDDRLQLLQVHLDAAVAGEADDAFVRDRMAARPQRLRARANAAPMAAGRS